MESKVAVVAGSTGLVGKELVLQLLADPAYDRVIALTRRPLGIFHKKLDEKMVSFDKLCDIPLDFTIDDAFCCLGTTIKKAGSKSTFYQTDFTFALRFAEWALENRASKFLMVSSLGANPNSIVFYNRVKGELEATIEQLKYRSIHIFRPSLLLGKRTENRLGEDMGKLFNKVFALMIPNRYKGILASEVAQAMVRMAVENHSRGIFFHESEQIHQMSVCKGVVQTA